MPIKVRPSPSHNVIDRNFGCTNSLFCLFVEQESLLKVNLCLLRNIQGNLEYFKRKTLAGKWVPSKNFPSNKAQVVYGNNYSPLTALILLFFSKKIPYSRQPNWRFCLRLYLDMHLWRDSSLKPINL